MFYVLYSPSSWAPVLEALGSFNRLLELDNFFLLAAYFGILYIAGAIIYGAYRYYQSMHPSALADSGTPFKKGGISPPLLDRKGK